MFGINKEGRKDLPGMYIFGSKGANFWLEVLTDLHNHGVQDIMIYCVGGLKSFSDAICSVFPETSVQLCVVHQIRSSIKYVGSKHQKKFMKGLKTVYGTVSKESQRRNLTALRANGGEMYPIVIRSWHDNWEKGPKDHNNLTRTLRKRCGRRKRKRGELVSYRSFELDDGHSNKT